MSANKVYVGNLPFQFSKLDLPELFRGFEVILRDKDPQAGLVVTPRACGICGASHLTCAAWALDTAARAALLFRPDPSA